MFSTGDTISSTPNHPFFSEDKQGYLAVGDLSIGERVSLAGGNRAALLIAKRRRNKGPEKVYNLEVEYSHNFYVAREGVLVHNSCLIKSWKEAVDAVEIFLNEALTDIKNILPNSKIGYRGSLATGIKYSTGGPFDINDWDVDAFIVDNDLAAQIGSSAFRNARDIPQLVPIIDELEGQFKLLSGYRIEPNKPFTFRVWTESEFNAKVKPYGYKLF